MYTVCAHTHTHTHTHTVIFQGWHWKSNLGIVSLVNKDLSMQLKCYFKPFVSLSFGLQKKIKHNSSFLFLTRLKNVSLWNDEC